MVEAMMLPLQTVWMGMPVWTWLMFLAIVLVILALDLGLLQKDAHKPSFKESAALTAFAMLLGASFSFVVYALYANGIGQSLDPEIAAATPGAPRAWMAWELYLTGWIIEQTLAFDNVFVMAMIFSYFAIPPQLQHRVLFYGILGVIVLRALMIGLGAALIHHFEWILYVFSAFLLFTGIKMFVMADEKPDIGTNPALNWMRRHLRITPQLEGQSFFVRRPNGKTGKMVTWATPLLVALILIEFADIIFAVDSVPAIFAITQDPFIVYTSNIFAILCLRSLYFVLASMVDRFEYLKYALALVLIYVGGKIFAQQFIGKIDPTLSLLITVGILAGGILLSLWKTRQAGTPAEPPAGR
jgi:tellurite resistance protein TerC